MKLFSWDFLFATFLQFVLMFLIPVLFSFKMFGPMTQSLSDFRITDIFDSKIVQRDQLMADTNMILINTRMNNEDISNFGLAKLINEINKCKPKVIGLKKIIKESDEPKYDMLLAKVLSQCKNLVMSVRLENYNHDKDQFDVVTSSAPLYSQFASVGYENFLKDKDEKTYTIRGFYPKLKALGKEMPSFSLKVAKLYKPEAVDILLKRKKDVEFINYLGHYQFYRLEMSDVLDQNFEPEFFQNKIVLIGPISTKDAIDSNMALNDVFFTPLNISYTGKTFPDMYGTILHANIISMILNENYIESMPGWALFLISAIIVYFNMALFTFIVIKNKKWYEIISLAVFVIESLLLLIATIVSFIYFKYEMNLTTPIFAIAFSVIVYEIYNSSLKPLTIRTYYKFFHKGY